MRFNATATTEPIPIPKKNTTEAVDLLLRAVTLMCEEDPELKEKLLTALQEDTKQNEYAS